MLRAVRTDGSAVAWTGLCRRKVDFLQGRSHGWQSQLIPDQAISSRLQVARMDPHTLFPSCAPGTAWYFLASSRVPEYRDGPWVRSGLTATDVISFLGWTRGDEQGPSPPSGFHQPDFVPSDLSCHKHGEHKREPDALELKSQSLCWGPAWVQLEEGDARSRSCSVP